MRAAADSRPDPRLVARVLRELRRRARPVTGDRLAAVLNVSPVRRVQEAVHEARCSGWRITASAEGYLLVRRRVEVEAFLESRRRARREESRALRGMERGYVAQARLIRERRAS